MYRYMALKSQSQSRCTILCLRQQKKPMDEYKATPAVTRIPRLSFHRRSHGQRTSRRTKRRLMARQSGHRFSLSTFCPTRHALIVRIPGTLGAQQAPNLRPHTARRSHSWLAAQPCCNFTIRRPGPSTPRAPGIVNSKTAKVAGQRIRFELVSFVAVSLAIVPALVAAEYLVPQYWRSRYRYLWPAASGALLPQI